MESKLEKGMIPLMGRKKKVHEEVHVGSVQFIYDPEWEKTWMHVYVSLIEEELRDQIERG